VFDLDTDDAKVTENGEKLNAILGKGSPRSTLALQTGIISGNIEGKRKVFPEPHGPGPIQEFALGGVPSISLPSSPFHSVLSLPSFPPSFLSPSFSLPLEIGPPETS